tara:strand:+ start:4355 stop:5095 length:741 start_codon:yes stop_codon:yes gene_type:complete
MSSDVGRSQKFYSSLFPEWDFQNVDLGEAGTYYLICVDGVKCGGIVPVAPTLGLTSHWIGYVEVTDCEAATECAIAEGGQVPVPTMDIPGMGKFAVIMDRQQAMLKALEPAASIEHSAETKSGQFYWDELLTTDVPSARSFYQSVFGWSAIEQFTQAKGEHTLMRAGDQDVAGIIPMASTADHSPAWLTYLYAENIDDRFALAESLGAQTVIAPRDIPNTCRFSVQVDPVGAVFAMMQLPAENLPD